MILELIVTDSNAPSDKYPSFGFSIDFKDDNNKKYFAEYPNYKSLPFQFEDGKKYKFNCNVKEVKSILSSKYHKISHIKNIVEILN